MAFTFPKEGSFSIGVNSGRGGKPVRPGGAPSFPTEGSFSTMVSESSLSGPEKPPFKLLSENPDFQAMIKDMLYRSGIPDEKIRNVIRDQENQVRQNVYDEFAKCFVPEKVDKKNNYELYEFMGDSAVNKATISYLFRKLHPLLSAKGSASAVGYMDKIKSVYVSKQFLQSMCDHLGFDEFLYAIIHNPKYEHLLTQMKEVDEKENVVEAFFGCMEIQLDRYVGIYSGYGFISNLIIDILESMDINYDPSVLWSNVVLLKESNDSIKSYNTSLVTSNNGNNSIALPIFTISEKNSNLIILQQYLDYTMAGPNKRVIRFVEWSDPRLQLAKYQGGKKIEEELAKRTLELLRLDGRFKNFIKQAPSAESLGIERLVK